MTLASSLQLANSGKRLKIQFGEMETKLCRPRNRALDGPPSTSRLAFALMLVTSRGLGDDHLSCERRTGNTVLFRGPRSQIRDLAALTTEWTPGV